MAAIQWARDSLAGRLSLYFGVGTLLTLGFLGTVLFMVFENQVRLRDANELRSKTVAVQTLVSGINQPDDVDKLVDQIRATEIGHDDLDIGILIDDTWVLPPGRFIIDHAHQNTVTPDSGIGTQMAFASKGKHWAMHHFAHRMTDSPDRVVQALVAIDVSETISLIDSLRNALVAIGFTGAAMIATLTWIATTRALAPLKRVAHEAERMTAQALGQPLSVANAPVEVRGLVTSINQMLSRLEKSFASLEQFSADIAHELRTPVNALLTQTQVTLSRERSINDYRETLHASLEELDRLQRMVGDMLFIARAERGVKNTTLETADLTRIAHEIVEYVELIASENNQVIVVDGKLTARGDPLMLRRAMTNLLTNAVRYAPSNARIALSLATRDGHAVVRVVNPYQELLTQAEVDRLFDRFSRYSRGQAGQHAGLGLGLSIVQSIMRVHNGQATAGVEDGHFWVQLHWPLRGG